MKCKNCGTEFEEGVFCPECGMRIESELSPEEQARVNAERAKKEAENIAREKAEQERLINEQVKQNKKIENEGKTMAVLSLIFGIVSIMTLGCFFIPEILGIVFAFLGKKQGKMLEMSKAGLICSVISIGIVVAAAVLVFAF